MLHLQRWLLLVLLLWCGAWLAEEVAARRADAAKTQPHMLAPRQWRLGKPYVEEVRRFSERAAGHIPPGEVVGLMANPRIGPGQRPILRMWFGYLMPRQHVRLTPRYPKHIRHTVDSAEEGSYFLAYRFRPARMPRLEAVFEHPIGGVYRVGP